MATSELNCRPAARSSMNGRAMLIPERSFRGSIVHLTRNEFTRMAEAGQITNQKSSMRLHIQIPVQNSGFTTSREVKVTQYERTSNGDNPLAVTKHYVNATAPYPDPLIYWVDGSLGKETKTEIYDATGNTLLRKTENEYEFRTTISGTDALGNTRSHQVDYRPTRTTNTLADVSPELESPSRNLPTTRIFPTTVRRMFTNTIMERAHREISNVGVIPITLPIRTIRAQPAHTFEDFPPNLGFLQIRRETTKFRFRRWNTITMRMIRIILLYLTARTSQDSMRQITEQGNPWRGNVTAMTAYANAAAQSEPITVYSQYDILGNVVKTVDAKGNVSTISYDDNFGAPDGEAGTNSVRRTLNGQSTFAFATSATNPAGFTTRTKSIILSARRLTRKVLTAR